MKIPIVCYNPAAQAVADDTDRCYVLRNMNQWSAQSSNNGSGDFVDNFSVLPIYRVPLPVHYNQWLCRQFGSVCMD